MMYIPEFKYTFYGPIVLGSILIGIIVASCLMAKAGTRKETVGFTAILTFVTIFFDNGSFIPNLCHNLAQPCYTFAEKT